MHYDLNSRKNRMRIICNSKGQVKRSREIYQAINLILPFGIKGLSSSCRDRQVMA